MSRFEMAYGKCYAALSLGRSSSLVKLRQQEKPEFVQFLIGTSGDRLFAEGGGRLIRDTDGNVIGAVGVTGDTEENDDALAAHGIHAAGLKIDEDCKASTTRRTAACTSATRGPRSARHAISPVVDAISNISLRSTASANTS